MTQGKPVEFTCQQACHYRPGVLRLKVLRNQPAWLRGSRHVCAAICGLRTNMLGRPPTGCFAHFAQEAWLELRGVPFRDDVSSKSALWLLRAPRGAFWLLRTVAVARRLAALLLSAAALHGCGLASPPDLAEICAGTSSHQHSCAVSGAGVAVERFCQPAGRYIRNVCRGESTGVAGLPLHQPSWLKGSGTQQQFSLRLPCSCSRMARQT